MTVEEEVELPDEDGLSALARRIDDASADFARAADVRNQLGAPETPIDEAVAAAFSYYPRANDDLKTTNYLRPMILYEVGSNPPDIAEMPEWVLRVWEECATRVTSPVARARFHDLCFEAKRSDVREHARLAAEAYIELAEIYPSASDQEYVYLEVALGAGRHLARALELARLKGLDEIANKTIEVLVRKADFSLTDEKAGPGVVLRLIRPLISDRDGSSRVDDLLVRARVRYRDDVFNTLSVTELQLKTSGLDDASRDRLRREEVQALLDAAAESTPVPATMHLEDAANRARKFGLNDMLEEATLRLQAMAGADMGFVRFETKFEIPIEAVNTEIDDIVGTTGWQDAFERLVSRDPPTGRVESNRSRTLELQASSPLASTMPVAVIGRDGLVRKKATSDDEIEDYQLSQIEVETMQIVGSIRIEALKKIVERWGLIDEKELATFLSQNSHVQPGVALALSRAFGSFFAGDFEGAALRAVPRTERVARELLLKMKAPVFRPPFGKAPGQYSGLGVMLESLYARGLDESWYRFLTIFLTRAEGRNFRNELLHGSEDEVDQLHAGLALIAALYLAVAVQVQEHNGAGESD